MANELISLSSSLLLAENRFGKPSLLGRLFRLLPQDTVLFSVVVFAIELTWIRQFNLKFLQHLFLLRSQPTIPVFVVKHMAFMEGAYLCTDVASYLDGGYLSASV